MSKSNIRRCVICNRAARLESYYKQRDIRSRLLSAYRDDMAALFKQHIDSYAGLDTHVLNDYEWARIYREYDGCALCGKEYDIRHLILRPKHGGKYTINNVIPLCIDCGHIIAMDENPFISTNRNLNSKAYEGMSDSFKEVVDKTMRMQ